MADEHDEQHDDQHDEEVDPDVEAAWDAEIIRRVGELDSGLVKTIPWSEARQQILRDR